MRFLTGVRWGLISLFALLLFACGQEGGTGSDAREFTDARVISIDAQADARAIVIDAYSDAHSIDATIPPSDAQTIDAARVATDAHVVAPDAAIVPDAHVIAPDATTVSDAHVATSDARVTTPDARIATPDATIHSPDAHVDLAPIASAQSVTVTENSSTSITLSATDVDTATTLLSYSVVTQPTHGAVSGTAPNLTYTPTTDFHGSDSFTFKANDGSLDSAPATVSITVTHVNQAPVATSQSVELNENAELNVTLAATDADGDLLTYTVVDAPINGTLSGTPPDLTYTPSTNFHGSDSFTFTANDGLLDSNIATVSITVDFVDHAPVATPQNVTVNENSSTSVTLTGTDVDNDTLTFTVVAQPTNGTLTGTSPNLIYTPSTNFHGSDSFTFKANDGALDSNVATVSITVTHVNQAPVAVSQNATVDENSEVNVTLSATDVDLDLLTYAVVNAPTHGSLSGIPPNLTYTPATNFHGSDSFTFSANDGALDSNVATVSITVNHINQAPVATPQNISVNENASTSVTLVGTDVDNDALTFAVVAQPTNGTLSGSSPNLTYTPSSNFHGSDSFTFKANDGALDSNVATVSITVNFVDQAPVATAQTLTTDEGNPLTTTLAATDFENDPLTFAIATQPAHGVVSGTPPNVTYTPNDNFFGTDSFTFIANDGTVNSTPASVSITVNENFVMGTNGALVVGFNHACVLVNGGVWCWGNNAQGQLGNNTKVASTVPVLVIGIASGAQQVAAGTGFTCALVNGGVWCWGLSASGQLGNGLTANQLVPTQVTGLSSGVRQIGVGGSFACALIDDGTVRCWGDNSRGELGDGTFTNRLVPVTVAGLSSNVHQIATGGLHICAIVDAGIQCWGQSSNGELGNGSTVDNPVPQTVLNISSGVQAIALSSNSSCAIVNGAVLCWGLNNNGQLGNGGPPANPQTVEVASEIKSGAKSITGGSGDTFCAIIDGGAKCWGVGTSGQLGNGSTTNSFDVVPVTGLSSGVQAISAGGAQVCAIVNGGIMCWGANNLGQLGNHTKTASLTPVSAVNLGHGVQGISAGASHACAIVNGGAQCWGNNANGELGNGSTTNSLLPVSATNLKSGVQQIAPGQQHTCALVNGGVQCWGRNAEGELGNGDTADSDSPVAVIGLTSGVQAISSGAFHTCALSNGGVQCWGSNPDGELGNDASSNSNVPVAVTNLSSGVASLVASSFHTCVVVSGAVSCWGRNDNNALGNEAGIANSPVPVAVSTLTADVIDLASSSMSLDSCAIEDGGAQCWSDDSFEQLGYASLSNSGGPVTVSGFATHVQSLAAGAAHLCAIIDGGVQCLGSDSNGQLGDGASGENATAVGVIGLANGVPMITTGASFTCAMFQRSVSCWGANDDGQLGDGNTNDSAVPVAVSGWTD